MSSLPEYQSVDWEGIAAVAGFLTIVGISHVVGYFCARDINEEVLGKDFDPKEFDKKWIEEMNRNDLNLP